VEWKGGRKKFGAGQFHPVDESDVLGVRESLIQDV